MQTLRHRPLLLWTGAFATGIAAGTWRPLSLPVVGLVAVIGLALLLAPGRRWAWAAAGIVLAGMAAGALRLAAAQAVPASDVSRWAGRQPFVRLYGTVVSDPERQPGRTTLDLRAQRIAFWGRSAVVTGNVSVSLLSGRGRAGAPILDYADRVVLDGQLEVPNGATNPGAFSWRDYLARRAIFCQLTVKQPEAVHRLGAGRLNPFLSLAWWVRRRVLAAAASSLAPTRFAVLSGILIGRRTDLPPDLAADFVHTGTVHILASAGLHVGVVAVCLMALCTRLTLPRKGSALLIILLLLLYALMAGGRPAVTRAVLMAILYFGAFLFEREPDLPTAMAAAALWILWRQPAALLEAGFQLSFATVATLALAMPVWEEFWQARLARVRPGWARRAGLRTLELAGLAIWAQAGSAPVVAAAYNEVSLSGLAANLLVVPVLFLLIPLGFGSALVWNLWPGAGAAGFGLAGLLLRYVVWVVRWFGEAPWGYRAIASPPALAVAAYYAALASGLLWLRARLAPPPPGGGPP